MDNATYHKNRQLGADLNVATANSEQLANYIVNFAPTHLGLDDLDLFLDEDGEWMSADDLRQIIGMSVPPPPTRVQQIARDRGCCLEHTAPYYPECQPMEKWNGNLKWSYRTEFDLEHKIANVGAAVHEFAENVEDEDVESWVQETDGNCLKVLNRDPRLLTDLEIASMPPI